MPKVSVKAAAREAAQQEARTLKAVGLQTKKLEGVKTLDSFQNLAQGMGIGGDNALSTIGYGFNPITRNRTLLEWMHRGSWIVRQAVDVIPEDMTRSGIDFTSTLSPDDAGEIEHKLTGFNTWGTIADTLAWGRLYGGAIAVMLIDGQDMATPLRVEAIGPDDYKGLLVLDRWMVDPSLDNLVTDFGPSLGHPKFYRVGQNAPALKGRVIHHSRVAVRHSGMPLPYQQRLTENLWGVSVIEPLFDRLGAFDMATTGAAQLINKAYLRTVKIKDLRQIAAAGVESTAYKGLTNQINFMRSMQNIEGITILDGEDEFEAASHSAFSGLDQIISQFGQQLAGALQMPLTRLFGQSPNGMSATGESDLQTYYDSIRQKQERELKPGVTLIHRVQAASLGIKLPDDFGVTFRPNWQLSAVEKSTVAQTNTATVLSAKEAGLIDDQTALRELRQSSRETGVFTNVTDELIDAADDQVKPPPDPMEMMKAEAALKQGPEDGDQTNPAPTGPQGQEGAVGDRASRRRFI